MVCIKSLVSVQVVFEGDKVETLGFVSVVDSRIVSELRGIKFELKIRLNQVIMLWNFAYKLTCTIIMHKHSIAANDAHGFIFHSPFFTDSQLCIHVYIIMSCVWWFSPVQ